MMSLALFFPVGVLLFALGIPLYCEKAQPNHWYGVRTRLTLEDRDAWFALNRRGGKVLMLFGGAIAFVSSALALLNVPPLEAALINLVMLVGGATALAVDTYVASRRWPRK